MHDLEQPDDCRTLVSHFYARGVKDPILAPIFAGRITSWDEHLDVMTASWVDAALRHGPSSRPYRRHERACVTRRVGEIVARRG